MSYTWQQRANYMMDERDAMRDARDRYRDVLQRIVDELHAIDPDAALQRSVYDAVVLLKENP